MLLADAVLQSDENIKNRCGRVRVLDGPEVGAKTGAIENSDPATLTRFHRLYLTRR